MYLDAAISDFVALLLIAVVILSDAFFIRVIQFNVLLLEIAF